MAAMNSAGSSPKTLRRRRKWLNASDIAFSRSAWDSLGLTQPLHSPVSIGVCMAEPCESTEALVGRTDQGLYERRPGDECVASV
jgi:hypothetical protein